MFANARVMCVVELKPGMKVLVKKRNYETYTAIKRICETEKNSYVVLYDDTWRPLSTFGRTWEVVDKYNTYLK